MINPLKNFFIISPVHESNGILLIKLRFSKSFVKIRAIKKVNFVMRQGLYKNLTLTILISFFLQIILYVHTVLLSGNDNAP